jgi:hypothetical protein
MNDTKERRTERRLLCAELVELVWRDNSGREKRRVANLEDISPTGMCLQMETPVYAGTDIQMLYGTAVFSGIVRYTVYRDNAYVIGIELDEQSRWSAREFLPSHLLDPEQLLEGAAARALNFAPVSSRIH